MKTIKTPKGDVQLLAPPVELLRTIRAFLPYGFVGYGGEQPKGAHFGLVMQCDDQEVFWVKQQPVPCDEEQGFLRFQANSILIALSLAEYLRHGFDGLFMPCAYIRKRTVGRPNPGLPTSALLRLTDRKFRRHHAGRDMTTHSAPGSSQ